MKLTLIHEHNATGQHRIIVMAEDGTNSSGPWAEAHQLAHHLDLHASADPSFGLPPGIFRTKELAHQVLA